MTINGEMDTSPCCVCGGQRRIRCNFCGGTGKIRGAGPGHDTKTVKKPSQPEKSGDLLAGRWETQGGYYDFIKDGNKYVVTEYNVLGKSGSGTATLAGNKVTFNIRNNMIGSYTILLELNNNIMQGTLNIMGMATTIIYRKIS
ncbi:MAG: hypothetical protein P8107_07255 [Spirochaetia bacterium]